MNDTSYLLNNSIYPAIHARALSIFPEFEFKPYSQGWRSTNKLRITGRMGNKEAGKVEYWSGAVYGLKDYTEGFISIWDYIANREGLRDNQKILQRLAELAGVNLPELSSEVLVEIEAKRKQEGLYDILQDFFTKSLANASSTSSINEYIKERQLDKVEDLGFIPTIKELEAHLKETGQLEEYKEAIKLHINIGKTHQLTIPYRDYSGAIVGFVFRQIKPEEIKGVGKYLYSGGLKVSEHLFNLNNYKRGESVIVVEGVIDSLQATKEGLENVVAIGGSNLTEKHVRSLLDLKTKEIILILDNDPAGKEGTKRAIEKILKIDPYNKIYVVALPEGIKDPDQFIKEKGVEDLKKLIKKHKAIWYLYLANDLTLKYNLTKDRKEPPTNSDLMKFKEEAFTLSLGIKDLTDVDIFTKGIESWTSGIITKDSFAEERERRLREHKKEETKRKLSSITYDVQRQIVEGDTKGALEILKTKIGEIEKVEARDQYQDYLKPLSEKAIKEEIQNTPNSLQSGYKVFNGGYPLDLMIPAGAFTVIGARTSHGKTALLMNLTLNILSQLEDKTIHFFTYEESKEAIALKLMNTYINKEFKRSVNNIDYIRGYYKNGGDTYNNPDFLELKEKFFKEVIDTGRIKIHFKPLDVVDLVNVIKLVRERDNAGAVFIDYIQKIPIKDVRYNTRQAELGQIGNQLIAVSVETGLPIITASQFNREVKTCNDLDLNKLREAGDIEQDANTVIGLWNYEKNPEGENKEGLYIKVLKNRNGVTGSEVTLSFNGNTGKISNPRDNSSMVESGGFKTNK